MNDEQIEYTTLEASEEPLVMFKHLALRMSEVRAVEFRDAGWPKPYAVIHFIGAGGATISTTTEDAKALLAYLEGPPQPE